MDVIEGRLAGILRRTWWLLLLRGLMAIAFGVLSWVQPGISLAALVMLFGVYALIDGVAGVWSSLAGHKDDGHWWVLLLWGVVGVGVGTLTLSAPGITALALLFYIALWAVATGVLQIVAAVRLRKEIEGEWLLGLSGLASVAFGVVLMARPMAGAVALLWIIATYAILFGILLVVLAFKARSFGRTLGRPV
ncbi:MAG: DUF308 domain-containing protein [Verrucomicrobiota bacterium]